MYDWQIVDMLLVGESAFDLQPLFPHWLSVRLVARNGALWRGDWASSFSWLRRAGPFSDAPGPRLMDMRFERVIPAHVIAGCNLLDFQARVYTGIVVGGVHKAAAIRGPGKIRKLRRRRATSGDERAHVRDIPHTVDLR